MAYFLSFLSLSDELEQVNSLALIVGMSRFPIFGKNSPQSHLINIIEILLKRLSQKQLYPHIKIFQ